MNLLPPVASMDDFSQDYSSERKNEFGGITFDHPFSIVTPNEC